jgi:hypothetical protein
MESLQVPSRREKVLGVVDLDPMSSAIHSERDIIMTPPEEERSWNEVGVDIFNVDQHVEQ